MAQLSLVLRIFLNRIKDYSIKYYFLNGIIFNFFESFIKILRRIEDCVRIKCFLIFHLFWSSRLYFSILSNIDWIEVTQYCLSFMNNNGSKSWKKQLRINQRPFHEISHWKLFGFDSLANFIELCQCCWKRVTILWCRCLIIFFYWQNFAFELFYF